MQLRPQNTDTIDRIEKIMRMTDYLLRNSKVIKFIHRTPINEFRDLSSVYILHIVQREK